MSREKGVRVIPYNHRGVRVIPYNHGQSPTTNNKVLWHTQQNVSIVQLRPMHQDIKQIFRLHIAILDQQTPWQHSIDNRETQLKPTVSLTTQSYHTWWGHCVIEQIMTNKTTNWETFHNSSSRSEWYQERQGGGSYWTTLYQAMIKQSTDFLPLGNYRHQDSCRHIDWFILVGLHAGCCIPHT